MGGCAAGAERAEAAHGAVGRRPAQAESRDAPPEKSCLQIGNDLDAFLDGRLSLEPDADFSLYLTACRNCCRAFEARISVRRPFRGRDL